MADAATARRLTAELQPGQILVTRDGGAWRWDGLTTMPGTGTAAAIRLTQRNRLAELQAALDRADIDLTQARRAHTDISARAEAAILAARRAQEAAQAGDRQARDGVRHAFAAVDQARGTPVPSGQRRRRRPIKARRHGPGAGHPDP